jgi:hypothetical protein
MRRIVAGLFLCALSVSGCAPGGGGSSVPASRPAQAQFAVPERIAFRVPPAPPNFVPPPPSSASSDVRRTAGKTTSGAAQATFFTGAQPLSNGVYYLQLPNGNIFGYYSYLPNAANYIYHFDMGYEYVVDANDGGGVYFYDFASSHWWYTGRSYPFPYIYDFGLNAYLYYYADANNAGHYTTNPRYFYDFTTSQIIQLPAPAVTAKAVQRADAQALLTVLKVLGEGGYAPGNSVLGAMGRLRRAAGVRRPQTANCNPGGPNGSGSGGSVSVTDTQDGAGDHQVYSDFYDANCAQPERVATLNYPPGSNISAGTATGYTTDYNRAGAVTGYSTHQQTFNANIVTVQTADAKTVGGTTIGQGGATCVPGSGTAVHCSLASFMLVGGITTGLLATVDENVTGGNNNLLFNGTATFSATAYADAGGGLSLVPPAAGGSQWGVSGGSTIDSLAGGSGSVAYNGSFPTAIDYTQPATGSAGYTATAHLSGWTLTITLAKSGTTAATVVVDDDGDGTVTYAADSSTEAVASFTIFG